MERTLSLVFAVAAALGLAACSVVKGEAPRQGSLIFSHAKHQQRGVACIACHAGATTSRSAVDNLLPTELECRACHPIDRDEPERVVAGAPPARCAACHLGYAPTSPCSACTSRRRRSSSITPRT